MLISFRVCNKQLSNKRSLEKHMEIHLDVKPFVCNLCGHATRLKESLITHKRLHTGMGLETLQSRSKWLVIVA